VLIKDRLALERLRHVDAVVFDKTGTLTLGAHTLTDVVGVDRTPAEVLALAAAIEAESEHPLARAIVAAAPARPEAPATDFVARPGRGVEATVQGTRYAVGGPSLLRERRLEVPADLRSVVAPWRARGAAVLYLLRIEPAAQVLGALALDDQVRPEARAAVKALQRAGIDVVMMTGDSRDVAERVATELGIAEVRAEVLPEDKATTVAALQAEGRIVAMVGDGVNDAPALARADVGLAIGAGTDVAIESAGVVLASSDPRGVLVARRLSHASFRKMVQNLAWATGYNVVALPLAAGTMAWAGLDLGPAIGAVLMSLSTIVVALNAQLLRRVELRPEALAPVGVPDQGEVGLIEVGSGSGA
jgi:Cu2+-exporting ATPase